MIQIETDGTLKNRLRRKYRQNTNGIPTETDEILTEYRHNRGRILTKYRQDTDRIQTILT